MVSIGCSQPRCDQGLWLPEQCACVFSFHCCSTKGEDAEGDIFSHRFKIVLVCVCVCQKCAYRLKYNTD